MSFRGREVLQSRTSRVGDADGLSVALLPNRLIQRMPEPDKTEPLVIHLVAPKVKQKKIEHFKELVYR